MPTSASRTGMTAEADGPRRCDTLHCAPRHAAIQRMVEYAPSTGGLALWVATAGAATGHCDTAGWRAAGGHRRPARCSTRPAFDTLPLPQQAGLVAHAVLHVALRHPQRLHRAAAAAWATSTCGCSTLCADAIVNSALGHLAWLQLPPATRCGWTSSAVRGAGRQQSSVRRHCWNGTSSGCTCAIDDRRPPQLGQRPAQ